MIAVVNIVIWDNCIHYIKNKWSLPPPLLRIAKKQQFRVCISQIKTYNIKHGCFKVLLFSKAVVLYDATGRSLPLETFL